MLTELTNKKIVLITGGSDGLGKALATILKDTYKVIILSYHEEKLKKVAEELGVDYVLADISKYDEVEKAIQIVIDKYQKIDCLVNNAGVWIDGQLDEVSPEDIKRIIDTNTTGTMFVTRATLPFMKKEKTGKIINVISQGGLIAKEDRSVYYASKWALTGFTKCLQIDLESFNINVSGFYPGFMNTNLFDTNGSTRDVTGAMDPNDVAKTLKFIVDLPNHMTVTELGINHL